MKKRDLIIKNTDLLKRSIFRIGFIIKSSGMKTKDKDTFDYLNKTLSELKKQVAENEKYITLR